MKDHRRKLKQYIHRHNTVPDVQVAKTNIVHELSF